MADKPHDHKSSSDHTPDPEEQEDDLYAIADTPDTAEPPKPKREPQRDRPTPAEPADRKAAQPDENDDGTIPLDEPAAEPRPESRSKKRKAAASASGSASAGSTATEQAPPKPPKKKQPTEPADPVHCAKHPNEIGKWFCKVCNVPVCRECVRIDEDAKMGRPVAFCLKCDTPCGINKAARQRDEYDNSPFLARLGRGFAYPLRGHNWVILTLTAVPFTLLFLFGAVFPFALLLLVPLLAVVFIIPWMYDIISESAAGNRDMPNVDIPSDPVDDILRPLLFFASAGLAAYLPALLVWWLMPGSALQQSILGVLWLAGSLFLPMFLLITVLFESPLAIRPSMVFAAMRHMGIGYVVYLIIMSIVPGLIFAAVALTGPLASLVVVPAVLYLLTLNAHLLGQLYHAHRHDLKWFA